MALPALGTRFAYSGHIGTIRYVGPVDGTQGLWLGVEWDDSRRGKHDGVRDGRRYFSCLFPGSGSFIRPSSAVSFGTTFLKALISKYVELPHGPGMETVVLGSSRGAISVEAVNLDKIRGNLSQVGKLREVSLDNEQVAAADAPGEIAKTCTGTRGLDLSKNLLPSWDVVATIVGELSSLERLAVNQNRLEMPTRITEFQHAFSRIKELQLNATFTTWDNIRVLESYMPSLQLLETGYNQLRSLRTSNNHINGDQSHISELQVINFDSNELTDWTATCDGLRPFTKLQRLVLSSNHFTAIDPIANAASSSIRALKHLALASNFLATWTDIDRISHWCPELESLTLAGNPLVEDKDLGTHARQFIIARIPNLAVLDAAKITPQERADCELYYLSYVSKHGPADDAAKLAEHPRWRELCEKYGKSLVSRHEEQEKQDTLGNRLVQITVHQCKTSPVSHPTAAPEVVETASLRVLPSMTARTFRMKLAKSFKIPRPRQAQIKLWLKMPDDTYAEIEGTEDNYDLAWWGMDDGSLVYLVVE